MKVLFLTSWYPTKTNPNFGIFVKEHAKAIQTTDNEIVVLAIVIHYSNKTWNITVSDKPDESGIRTVLIEIHTRFRNLLYHVIPLQYFIVKKTFNKRLKSSFTPDLIHSNVIFPAGIMGNWLSSSLRKPHVITEHWSRLKGFLDKPILSKWGIEAYKNAAKILPVSEFLKNRMVELLPIINKNKFQVVPNVIDSETFYFKEKTNNQEIIRFCAVATWANKKNPDKLPELFIEALGRLQKKISKTLILTMIGGGDKVNELKEFCQQNGLDVEFTGYLEKSKIAEYLQKADYFVHASTIETFGVVVAEALMTGTPVICSNVGALPELINKSNGVLCENTVEEWIEGIKSALNKSSDNQQISTDIKNKFDKKQVGKQIDLVYQSL